MGEAKLAHAVTKYIRVPPRKARLAADLIRGLNVEEALNQLTFCKQKSGFYLKKTIESARANLLLNSDVRKESVKVAEVRVDEGPRLKRGKPRSKGSRVPVLKRMSHFTVVVSGE